MIDKTDKQILKILECDGRISFASLGDQVGLSKSPCWNRVKTLVENGVIEQFNCSLNPEKLGLSVRALVHVVVNFGQYQAFEKAILAHRYIRACHAVTGEFDYVLEVLASDIPAFDHLLREELSGLPGVERFNTSLSTRVVKQGAPFTGMS